MDSLWFAQGWVSNAFPEEHMRFKVPSKARIDGLYNGFCCDPLTEEESEYPMIGLVFVSATHILWNELPFVCLSGFQFVVKICQFERKTNKTVKCFRNIFQAKNKSFLRYIKGT